MLRLPRFRYLMPDFRERVHADMYNSTPNTMARVQQNCRAALDLYRVFKGRDLPQQPVFRNLPAASSSAV